MTLKERIEEIIKEFEKESLYGRNYCKQEQKSRDPNSIGCCDYCGGEITLQTLAEAILKAVELNEEIYCVITVQKKWSKPEGCGFIYRNLLGVYSDIDKARALQKRFMDFVGGVRGWKRTNVEEEYQRCNCLLGIIVLNPLRDMQIFDYNH